jgi:predicted YcjX-like family ATPase
VEKQGVRLTDITDPAVDALRSAGAYVAEFGTPTLRLGVTGLARAGKTIFITALVRNLLVGGRLPFFMPAKEGRILRAWLEPQPDDSVPRFAYEEHLEKLAADPPEWPESTRRISQLRVTLEYLPTNRMRRALGPRRLHLDIVDYPGEWLLDLPMLELDFAAWSAEALELARAPARADAAAEFLAFLATLDAAAPADEQQALAGARLFTTYLNGARARDHALSIAGPGRFLLPGDLEGSPLLTFFPLPREALPAEPARGSLAALLQRRYASYRTHVVEPFYRDHFARLDRQIVLVDALAALDAGGSAIDDLEGALAAVLGCFRAGASRWLDVLLGRRIDRVLLAASKADLLHPGSHRRLEAILALLTERATRKAVGAGAELRPLAIAAIRATREAEVARGGERFECIAGVPLPGERIGNRVFDGKAEAVVFPGELPERPEEALAAARAEGGSKGPATTRFVRFRPPRLAALGPDGAPPALEHIRLDLALDYLIGDRLQ